MNIERYFTLKQIKKGNMNIVNIFSVLFISSSNIFLDALTMEWEKGHTETEEGKIRIR